MTLEEQIYEIYPRHIGKGAALVKIRRAITKLMYGEAGFQMTREEAVSGLIIAVAAYAKAREGQDQAFTPYPATWFNQSRYLDDTKEWARQPESPADALERRNRESLAKVFGAVPDADGSAFFEGADGRGRQRLEGSNRQLSLKGD